MSVSRSISRFTEYYKRHGLAATFRRAAVATNRMLFAGRMAVFYFDLGPQVAPGVDISASLKVERLKNYSELSATDLQEMISFRNPKQADRNIRERFKKGASLWLIRSEDKLTGYGWSLRGGTIEPYYVVLAQGDVHLFDFHVFPEHRGHGLNPLLVNYILSVVSSECEGRAYIDAAEWNAPQLSSLRKTPFRRLGFARSFGFLGHTFVSWTENAPAVQSQGVPQKIRSGRGETA